MIVVYSTTVVVPLLVMVVVPDLQMTFGLWRQGEGLYPVATGPKARSPVAIMTRTISDERIVLSEIARTETITAPILLWAARVLSAIHRFLPKYPESGFGVYVYGTECWGQ